LLSIESLRCLGEGRESTPQQISSCGLGPALEQVQKEVILRIREEELGES
jgi:hypothetical protein